jgi:hypothetical protein
MKWFAITLALLPRVAAGEEKRDDAAAEMAKADDFYFNKKDTQSAIAHYNAARMLAPDKPGPYLALGIAYASINDCKSAVSMMQKYLALKTSDVKPDAQRVIDECKTKQPGLGSECPPGMVKSADTAGHCCWPAQVWVQSENRCVGLPQCPPGYVIGPHKAGCLATGGCPPGKVASQDPKQCCWPGQGFSHELKKCVGQPACPPNMIVAGEDCIAAPTATAPPRPPGPLPRALDRIAIKLAMDTRARPMVASCYAQYKVAGQVRVSMTVRPNGTIQQVRALPPFAGTPTGICLEETLLAASFPPFSGPPQTIIYPFTLR